MQEEKHTRGTVIPAQYKMRLYENVFPEKDQLVMAQVKNSEENGCYIYLLEYDMKQGMIPINEYTKTMKKAIHRAMKVGKKQVLRVIRVDKEKGYIDLSKKQVSAEDQKVGEEKYANATMIHSILIHISEKSKVPIIDLYTKIIWPMYKKQLGGMHPLLYLKSIMLHQDRINDLHIEDSIVKNQLLNEVKRRFKTSILKTMAEFSVQIKSFEGINAIKKILIKGVQTAKQHNFDVKISIIGAPKYTCYVETSTQQSGKQALKLTLDAMKAASNQYKGDFKVDKEPKTVGDVNAHIQELIKKQQQQNANNSGQQMDQDD